MTTITIRTNNVPRNLIFGYELTEEERANFDYIQKEDIDSHEFFRYKGMVYDPSQFMRIPQFSNLSGWHGYSSDTAFSGTLIKYVEAGMENAVVVGQYFS